MRSLLRGEGAGAARAPALGALTADTLPRMLDALRAALAADQRIDYAILFGSHARGASTPHSDVDVAIGLAPRAELDALALGALVTRLEAATGRPVELVLMHEAPPGLAYRVFRDGVVILVHDRRALTERRARAILEYLDFKPFEELFTRGALAAARGR